MTTLDRFHITKGIFGCILVAAAFTLHNTATAQSDRAGTPAATISGEPMLLYSDLTSGPSGAFVTVWGWNLPADMTLICGDQPCEVISRGFDPHHPGFSRQPPREKIVVRYTSGSGITLKGANTLPFETRRGKIREMTPGPIGPMLDKMRSGDVLYLRGGLYNIVDPDSYSAIIWVDENRDGLAVIGYPGEEAILDVSKGNIRAFDTVGDIKDWTVANLTCRGKGTISNENQNGQCIAATRRGSRTNMRVVGLYNSGTGRNGSGAFGVFSNTRGLHVIGNFSEKTGTASRKTHVLYHGGRGTSYDVNFEYNRIDSHIGRRGIQVYGHHPGETMKDLRIRYNQVRGQGSDGILLSHSDSNPRVDPSHPDRNWISDATIVGNTVQGNRGGGITIKALIADVEIAGNTIAGNRQSIFVDFVKTADIYENCLDKPATVRQAESVRLANNNYDKRSCVELARPVRAAESKKPDEDAPEDRTTTEVTTASESN